MTRTTVSSCPGKVLLAGGYLVLDPDHQGFVLSTPSRFYTVVQSEEDAVSSSADGMQRIRVTVKSPQFLDGLWEYEASRTQGAEWELEQLNKDK